MTNRMSAQRDRPQPVAAPAIEQLHASQQPPAGRRVEVLSKIVDVILSDPGVAGDAPGERQAQARTRMTNEDRQSRR